MVLSRRFECVRIISVQVRAINAGDFSAVDPPAGLGGHPVTF